MSQPLRYTIRKILRLLLIFGILYALLIPILILQGAIGHPSSSTQAATNAASLLVTALAVQGAWLRSRHPPD